MAEQTPAERAGAPARGEPGDVAAWIVAGKPRWWHQNPPTPRPPADPWWRNWTVHNLVAHPVSEILHLVGLGAAGDAVHDATIPHHEKGTGRG